MKITDIRGKSAGLFFAFMLFMAFAGEATAQINTNTTDTTRGAPRQRGGFFIGGTPTIKGISSGPEINCGVTNVTFPAGVHTIWHSHAGGQIIFVVSGTAWYQEKGKSKQVLRPGETVVCLPGIMHWHGASPDGPMSHTVATPNMDKGGATSGPLVTDQEYRSSK
ncbi:MAG: cupin domain-containing protein [Bacteroidota bacterium]